MGTFEVEVVLPTGQTGAERVTQRWAAIPAMALAEALDPILELVRAA